MGGEEYTQLLDELDAVMGYYKGWTLTEVRSLSVRERREWIRRALRHTSNRLAAMREEG